MQIMFNMIDDHAAIRMLLKDLVERKKDLRYDIILDQIEETILMQWLTVVQKNKWWFRPAKCVVKFHLNDEHGMALPDSTFTLSTKIGGTANTDLENYAKRVRDALKAISLELRGKHDLDRVVFHTMDVRESIYIVVDVEETCTTQTDA